MVFAQRIVLKVTLIVLLLGVIITVIPTSVAFAEGTITPVIPVTKAISSLTLPHTTFNGIIWNGKYYWTMDMKNCALVKIEASTKKVTSIKFEPRNPKGLAWDGKYFWCADDATKTLFQIEPESGKTVQKLQLDLEVQDATLEGLAWDGKYLWFAYYAGWSSKICKLDITTGEVVLSIYADGYPKGLATNGKYIWTICNNGKNPASISQHLISDDPIKMQKSLVYLGKLPGKDPAGIFFDSKYFWVIDREKGVLQQVYLPPKQ